MPTIEISSPALPVPARRAVALRITRWLADRGIPPAHVVVRFTDLAANTLFSGGLPVDVLAGRSPAAGSADSPRAAAGPKTVRHASVTCCIGPDRDEAFRADLATEIAGALGLSERTAFLYIEFRPTSPAQVFLADRGELHRADQVPISTAAS
jgi:hypothetical protein